MDELKPYGKVLEDHPLISSGFPYICVIDRHHQDGSTFHVQAYKMPVVFLRNGFRSLLLASLH